jgi:hypothetical protein
MRATSSSYRGLLSIMESRSWRAEEGEEMESAAEKFRESVKGGEGSYQRRVQRQDLAGYCSWGRTSAQSKRSRRHSYKWK